MTRSTITTKKWVFLLSGLCAGFSGHTQNVTIDKEPVPVQYYRMPDEPLDPSYQTYSTEIVTYGGELIKSGITVSSLESEYLFLEGYRLDQRNGDVNIEATVSDFTIFSEIRRHRQRKTKDKDGKEVQTTVYWIEMKYALPVTLAVSDRQGRTLEDRFIFTLADQRTYSTPEHKSTSDLDSHWRIARTRKISDLHKSMLTEAFQKIRDAINNQFGYRRITNENARFERIGKKKHLEYAKYQKAVEDMKKGFELMDPDKSLDAVRTTIEPSLAFYKAQEKVYPAGDEDLAKIKHICLYNLALAYFWLEDFDQARQYTQALLKMDEKDRDAKRLMEDIDYVKLSLERANKLSRHQVPVARS